MGQRDEMVRDRKEEVRSRTLNKGKCIAIDRENWGPGGRGAWRDHTARGAEPGRDARLSGYAASPLQHAAAPPLPRRIISNGVD